MLGHIELKRSFVNKEMSHSPVVDKYIIIQYLPVRLSTTFLSIYLSIYLSICQLHSYLSIYLSICQLHSYLSIYLSILDCLMSVCMSVCPSTSMKYNIKNDNGLIQKYLKYLQLERNKEKRIKYFKVNSVI